MVGARHSPSATTRNCSPSGFPATEIHCSCARSESQVAAKLNRPGLPHESALHRRILAKDREKAACRQGVRNAHSIPSAMERPARRKAQQTNSQNRQDAMRPLERNANEKVLRSRAAFSRNTFHLPCWLDLPLRSEKRFDFFAIEFSVSDCEQTCRRAVIGNGERDSLQIAFVRKAAVEHELRIFGIFARVEEPTRKA